MGNKFKLIKGILKLQEENISPKGQADTANWPSG